MLDEAELIILAVPDDAIAGLAAELRMYGGQAMVHTSGALGAEVLEPARAAGTQIGAFHPLVAFADTERAIAALHGATVAIEGDEQLAALLARMAEAVGATAVRLLPGTKAAYHAAAVLAAGGFVALLDAIAELGRVAGLDEAGSLAIYGDLIEQTLGNARALGIACADRAGDARRRRARWPGTSKPCGSTPQPRCRCIGPPANARSRSPKSVARWHRTGRGTAIDSCDGGLTRYHTARWSAASPPGTPPDRRPVFPSLPPAPGGVVLASLAPAHSGLRPSCRRCSSALAHRRSSVSDAPPVAWRSPGRSAAPAAGPAPSSR